MSTSTVVKFDGGAPRCNPGPEGIGYTVEAKNWIKAAIDHLGRATDNDSEYHALIQGLEIASGEIKARVTRS